MAAIEEATDPESALRAAIASVYDVSEMEALQAKILADYVSLLETERTSLRKEEERLCAVALVREVERDWAELLRRAMDSGVISRRDEQELGLHLMGLTNSVLRWYRHDGGRTLQEISASITDACVRLVN